MLDAIISSKTRINLLIKFFLFDGNQSYLRKMEKEFNESNNAIRVELNRLTDAGLLTSVYQGKKRFFMANPNHPLYEHLQQIVRISLGVDQITEHVISKIEKLEAAYITGNFARGIDSDTIELALVGPDPDRDTIDELVREAEKIISRKIMYLTFTTKQMDYFFRNEPAWLIWKRKNKSHQKK